MAVLAAALIDRAQALSDKRNDQSVTAADWLAYVNQGVEALWRVLTAMDPDAYFATADFALAGGTTTASASKDLGTLTPTFRALHGLDKDPDTTVRRTIGRREFHERNAAGIGWWLPAPWSTDRRYDLRARTLIITPTERSAGNYRVYYRHAPYQFTSGADTTPLDFQLEPYEEYIEVFAALKALNIEESDGSPLAARLAEMRQEIADEHERDDEEAARISDVEEDGFTDRGYF